MEAPAASFEDISRAGKNEPSEAIRARVKRAREIQAERFLGTSVRCNGEMSGSQVKEFCRLEEKERQFMERIYGEMGLSARTYDKILKVARTAADLEESDEICHRHLCEAVSYVRFKERYWGK
mgnify:FL=1